MRADRHLPLEAERDVQRDRRPARRRARSAPCARSPCPTSAPRRCWRCRSRSMPACFARSSSSVVRLGRVRGEGLPPDRDAGPRSRSAPRRRRTPSSCSVACTSSAVTGVTKVYVDLRAALEVDRQVEVRRTKMPEQRQHDDDARQREPELPVLDDPEVRDRVPPVGRDRVLDVHAHLPPPAAGRPRRARARRRRRS